MKNLTFFICLLISLIATANLRAQEFLDRNQLIRQLSTTQRDTNRVLLYISIGQQYENNQPDSAIFYYLRAKELSDTLRYTTGTLKYISNITYVLNAQGKYDTALQLNLKAVELAKTHGKPTQLAACMGNVANSYLFMERYEEAVEYFLHASDLISKGNNKQYQCILFNNLAIVYHKLRQPEKGRQFAEQAVSLARETDDPYNLGISLDNLALNIIGTGATEEALPYLKEGLEVAEKTENIYVKESILINYADAYRRLGRFDQIKKFAEEGLKLAEELEDISGEATAALGLGYYHLFRDELNDALKYTQLSRDKAMSANLNEQLANAYALLANLALTRKDYLQFQNYQRLQDSVENLVVNERILKNIQDLEAKYETEKKVQQISQLEQDKDLQELRLRQSRMVMIALAGIILVISALGVLVIRSNRQKQLILTQEKELAATEAMLKGQDAERTRLARDLHDSLGGMLSGIKLSFMNLKETMAKNTNDEQAFDRSLDMLDGSIVELRRVAHNLMPETLLRFGLDTAIRDYCDQIAESGATNVTYQSVELEKLKAEESVLVTIYRIVQELVNNIVKHAAASRVYVQLAYHNEHLTISVEDNGKGFDFERINDTEGLGLSNIRHRVEYLKGVIDIQSDSAGTTVNIALDV